MMCCLHRSTQIINIWPSVSSARNSSSSSPSSLNLRTLDMNDYMKMPGVLPSPPQSGVLPPAPPKSSGIGILLGRNSSDDVPRIKEVVRGLGAAQTNKIFVGDAVLAIDGRPVRHMDLDTAKELCRGPEGSTVLLHIQRAGMQFQVSVTRIPAATMLRD